MTIFSTKSLICQLLQHSFGGWQFVAEHVAADGTAYAARQCLEYALNLVVLVVAASRDVKIHAGAVA